MTAIDPRASVLAALQARLAPLRSSPPRASAGAGGAGVLAQRIATLSRTDPDARRQALRLVLEVQLARAFGESVLADPAFPGLLEAVQQQMEGDAQAAAALRALGDWLLAAPA